MAIRQYIGARYVTKIYENSLDPASAEWESTVNYEPLTLVTYNNGSYLSKKEVPASVGNPAENPTYWVQTGFYNGQIASLQSQIDTINNTSIPAIQSDLTDLSSTVDDIENQIIDDNVILIGDSYGVDGAQWSGGTAWTTLVKNIFTKAIIVAGGQAGFDTVVNPFITMLQNATIEDKDSITQILIMGGANDAIRLHSGAINEASLRTAIDNFMTYAASDFPNAKVKVAFIGNHQAVAETEFETAKTIYKDEVFNTGGIYYPGGERILENNGYSSDTLHPTQEASNMFGDFGLACLYDAPYQTDYQLNADNGLEWDSDVLATSGTHFYTKFTESGCHLIIKGTAINGRSMCQIKYNHAIDISNELHIATLKNVPIYRGGYLCATAMVGDGADNRLVGSLIYNGNDLSAIAYGTPTGTTDTLVFSACDIFIPYL